VNLRLNSFQLPSCRQSTNTHNIINIINFKGQINFKLIFQNTAANAYISHKTICGGQNLEMSATASIVESVIDLNIAVIFWLNSIYIIHIGGFRVNVRVG